MSLALSAQLAPPGELLLWLGGWGEVDAHAALCWTLNGKPVTPTPVRPWSPVSAHLPHLFSGTFRIANVSDAPQHLWVSWGGQRASLTTRPCPATCPDAVQILLVSCYHHAQDPAGRNAAQVAALGIQPHFTFLMGDQVYLDLPTAENFPDDVPALTRKFAESYCANWHPNFGDAPAYGKILQIAPWLALPDDHEFWNNAPHPAPPVQNSWTAAGRAHWIEAASTLYAAFQHTGLTAAGQPRAVGEAYHFNLGALAFYTIDTRSTRDADFRHIAAPPHQQHFLDWCARLIQEHAAGLRRVAVITTGQPLLAPPAGAWNKRMQDASLADYDDYHAVWRAGVLSLLEHGCPVIALTGDIHFGRVTEYRSSNPKLAPLLEIITSPASLVRNVATDAIKQGFNQIKSLLGKADPWPRHSSGHPAPSSLMGDKRWHATHKHSQRGDQVAVLTLTPTDQRVVVSLTYHPLHSTLRQPVQIDRIKL